ncbi:MAG: hypothetical protein EBZ60_07960, partial [Betaproteobacteria bacterium]|nr:hypothetical protein [Betaproteobacteria bacterium]
AAAAAAAASAAASGKALAGAERHLLALVGLMVRAGHSVMVVALTGTGMGGAKNIEDDFRSVGARIAILDRTGVGWLRDAGRWFGLLRLAKAWAPDILHSHLPKADFAASLVKRILPGTIWISTVHDAYIKGVYSGYWVFRWLGWNWRLADHIIAVSGHARRWVRILVDPARCHRTVDPLCANCASRY